ncbi:hypothetical protein AK812_SmicGene36570 [Symbiodinium microadriaticum]|uniref:Protein kinase domain-containing protein n=1 Tax=Symbiodinium microadriaticum TaxID=2951 RepID=A0A1Q9CIJ3_SYMMI|nr:hypothetical protein AK812_SmicGene36570 [Symbiodinium microadriaticum]
MGVGACRPKCYGSEVGEDDPSADDNPVVLQFEIEQIGAPRWNLQTSPSQSVQEQPRHSQSASAPSSCSRRTCPDEPQMATATHMFGDGAEAAHLRRSRTSPELDAKLLSRSEFCFDFELHSVARCISCKAEGGELFLSPCDQQQYCKWCWIAADFNESGAPPSKWQPWPLIAVQVVCVWHAEELAAAWSGRELPRIPQAPQASCNAVSAPEATSEPAPSKVDIVSIIPIHLQPDMVGPLARECLQWRAQPGQLIQDRFRILRHLGRGSYTEAYLAEDVMGARKVCLKRHHMFDVEVLADLVVIDQRLHEVDPEGSAFPRLLEVSLRPFWSQPAPSAFCLKPAVQQAASLHGFAQLHVLERDTSSKLGSVVSDTAGGFGSFASFTRCDCDGRSVSIAGIHNSRKTRPCTTAVDTRVIDSTSRGTDCEGLQSRSTKWQQWRAPDGSAESSSGREEGDGRSIFGDGCGQGDPSESHEEQVGYSMADVSEQIRCTFWLLYCISLLHFVQEGHQHRQPTVTNQGLSFVARRLLSGIQASYDRFRGSKGKGKTQLDSYLKQERVIPDLMTGEDIKAVEIPAGQRQHWEPEIPTEKGDRRANTEEHYQPDLGANSQQTTS